MNLKGLSRVFWLVLYSSFSRAAALPLIALLALLSAKSSAQLSLGDEEERTIHYGACEGLQDPVGLLQKGLAAGKVRLFFEGGHGYLPSLLKALRIPVSSQALVFSKTSSQAASTSPQTPRAIYFADDISVAWVPGDPVIDIAAVDPQRGPIFYTLDQHAAGPPRFNRPASCMQCHLGRKTLNVPGLLVRSVYTATDGMPLSQVAGFVSGHNTPLEERWGGWYVTGVTTGTRHLGNTFVSHPEEPNRLEVAGGVDLSGLPGLFDSSRYLSPHSDVVALLVLEHELRMQNLITQANYESRFALDERTRKAFDCAHSAPDGNQPTSEWAQQRIATAGEMLLQYMLFRDEAPLKGPVRGTSGFAEEFQRVAPRASKGRSLRQFDLHTRLFRYPCSFLVYSRAFDALPQEMKSYLWGRLAEILSGRDQSVTYVTMPACDREAVLEILRETKPEFAAWLRQGSFKIAKE